MYTRPAVNVVPHRRWSERELPNPGTGTAAPPCLARHAVSLEMPTWADAPAEGEASAAIQVDPLTPPPCFGYVCPYIYRSADPTAAPESFSFLQTLGLKSIVLLSIEHPSKELSLFCAKNHIELHHFGLERRWPIQPAALSQPSCTSNLFFSSHEINSISVFESIVKDALELLLDVRNHPILVTDTYVAVTDTSARACLKQAPCWAAYARFRAGISAAFWSRCV